MTAPKFYWMLSLLLFYEQKASFQLVMASDYRTGRSYVMFNYDNIGWSTYRAAAQGYRDSTTYRSLFTSYTSLSYQLPTLTGNTGKDTKLRRCSGAPSLDPCHFGADPVIEKRWGRMASTEREPITGVWGWAPNRVQGNSLWSGSQGRSPLKLKAF